MELHKAIKEIIANKGAEMISNPQVINFLLDYQAFKEITATKPIFRDIINSGYADKIHLLDIKAPDWQTKFRKYQHDFIDSFGYKEELAGYVFQSIAYGLGLIHDGEICVISSKSEEIEKIKPIEIPNKKESSKQNSNPTNNKVSREFANKAIKRLYNDNGKIRNAFNYTQIMLEMSLSRGVPDDLAFLQKLGIVGKYRPGLPLCVIVCDIDEINRRVEEYFNS